MKIQFLSKHTENPENKMNRHLRLPYRKKERNKRSLDQFIERNPTPTYHQSEGFVITSTRSHETQNVEDANLSLIRDELIDEAYSLSHEGLPENDLNYRQKITYVLNKALHLIHTTNGKIGLDVLTVFDEHQWDVIFQNADQVNAVVSVLNSITLDSSNNINPLFLEALKQSQSSNQLKPLFYSAFILHAKDLKDHFSIQSGDTLNLPDFVSGQAMIQSLLTYVDNCTVSLPFSLSNIILESFGVLSTLKKLDPSIQNLAFNWCQKFDNNFVSFIDSDASSETKKDQKSKDRLVIEKTYEVMAQLNPEKAVSHFMDVIHSNKGFDFNPRIQKHLAHNDFYRRVSASQFLAKITKNKKLYKARVIDYSNNEWGRDFEKNLRDNEVFREDILNFADTSTENILDIYDPDYSLRKEFGFIHILRKLYQTDPERYQYINGKFQDVNNISSHLQNLDVAGFMESLPQLIRTGLELEIYENENLAFDAWLLNFKTNYPKKFHSLKSEYNNQINSYASQMSFQVFFMEANEIEIYQFEISPQQGPINLLNFVGKIRSWTSGWQGRIRLMTEPYIDQAKLTKLYTQNPREYKLSSLDLREKLTNQFYEKYAIHMSKKRFEITVLPILMEGILQTQNPKYKMNIEFGRQIISHLSETGFTAYLPFYIHFLIQYDFRTSSEEPDYSLIPEAFAALQKTKLPKRELQKFFENQGYLKQNPSSEKEKIIYQYAIATLNHSPKKTRSLKKFKSSYIDKIYLPISLAGMKDKTYSLKKTEKLFNEFENLDVTPGNYHKYRRLSRKLLKSKETKAIELILEKALEYEEVEFTKNTPLKSLFRGPIGLLATNPIIENAFYNIATSSSPKNFFSSLFDFSTFFINWAKNSHIDLNTTFGKAFESYQVPPSLQEIQSELSEISKEIMLLEKQGSNTSETKNIKKELSHRQSVLETRRLDILLQMANTENQKQQLAFYQIITFLYNEVKKQYLKEILISADEVTSEIINQYLEEQLFHKSVEIKNQLKSCPTSEIPFLQLEYQHNQRKIDFLLEVLANLEEQPRHQISH